MVHEFSLTKEKEKSVSTLSPGVHNMAKDFKFIEKY